MSEREINILGNTLEGMTADAEDNGRDYIRPKLTLEDARVICKALNLYESSMKTVVPETRGEQAPIPYYSPLADTVEGMLHPNYKERFKAEYQQTKIRYEKLKAFNNRIKASHWKNGLDMPIHDCPDDLLRDQQRTMGEYLGILEVRSVIEGIEL